MRSPLVLALILLAIAVGFFGSRLQPAPAAATPADARIADVVRQLKILHTDLGQGYGENTVNGNLSKMTRQLNEVCRSLSHMDRGIATSCF